MYDNMISGFHGDVDEIENGLFGAGVNEDILRQEIAVELGDLGSQPVISPRIRVAKPNIRKALFRTFLQCDQFSYRKAITVRGTQNVWRGELLVGEKAFKAKRFKFHSLMFYNEIRLP
jgi:hypothetical protein